MEVNIRYHPLVLEDDIPALSGTIKKRVKAAIENKLTVAPELYGEPLRGSLTPFWKLRVGDWRIVYGIEKGTVYIHAIAHRRHIYTSIASKRIRK